MIKTFESFKINLTEEEEKELLGIKLKKADRLYRFTDEEKQFFSEYIDIAENNNGQLTSVIVDIPNLIRSTLLIRKCRIDNDLCYFYNLYMSGKSQDMSDIQFIDSFNLNDRKKSIRKLMMSVYLYLKEEKLDDKGIEERISIRDKLLKKQEEMKYIDPYGEEQWCDDEEGKFAPNLVRPVPPLPPPAPLAQPPLPVKQKNKKFFHI